MCSSLYVKIQFYHLFFDLKNKTHFLFPSGNIDPAEHSAGRVLEESAKIGLWCSTHKIDGMIQIKPSQDRQFTADPKATLW